MQLVYGIVRTKYPGIYLHAKLTTHPTHTVTCFLFISTYVCMNASIFSPPTLHFNINVSCSASSEHFNSMFLAAIGYDDHVTLFKLRDEISRYFLELPNRSTDSLHDISLVSEIRTHIHRSNTRVTFVLYGHFRCLRVLYSKQNYTN